MISRTLWTVLLWAGVFIPSIAQCGVWQFQSCLIVGTVWDSWSLVSDVQLLCLIAHLNGMCASVILLVLYIDPIGKLDLAWPIGVLLQESLAMNWTHSPGIWFKMFGGFFQLVQGHFKNASQGCQHTFTQVLLYLPLLERLEYSGMFVCFIHTIWQTQKRIKREREFWAGYCYACSVFIDNAV